jgi:DNA-binding PucR family transcriptional regulator
MEQAALARVRAVADPARVGDPEYALGLTEAVGVGLAYGIDGIEAGEPWPLPIPAGLLAQARAAAHSGVSLDTVVRRYLAGYTLLGDFLAQEAERLSPRGSADLQTILRGAATLLDRVLEAVSAEHTRELESRSGDGAVHRRAGLVRKLLDGELVDQVNLDYEFDRSHLGVVATGPGAPTGLRDLGAALDRQVLLVPAQAGAVWAWLGGRAHVASRHVLGLAERILPREISLGLGEAGRGIEGWRLSHRQAVAAHMVAQRGANRKLRYADVALLSAALSDEVLAGSLNEIYLAPLEEERDAGAILRQTLSAYLESGGNASSAAALLGVTRKTVGLRLQVVEEKIGRSVEGCGAELLVALRLRELKPQSGIEHYQG